MSLLAMYHKFSDYHQYCCTRPGPLANQLADWTWLNRLVAIARFHCQCLGFRIDKKYLYVALRPQSH